MNHILPLINEFTSFVNNLVLRSAILFFPILTRQQTRYGQEEKSDSVVEVVNLKRTIGRNKVADTENHKRQKRDIETGHCSRRGSNNSHFTFFRQTGTARGVLASTEWRGRNQCLKERNIMKIVAS